MRDYNFVQVPPGQQVTIQSPTGDFFRVKESPVPLNVQFSTNMGGVLSNLTLEETSYVRVPRSFRTLNIVNMGDAPASFTVTLGFGETGSDTQAGTVETIAVASDNFVGLPALTLAAGANTITGNANRQKLIIQADSTNTGTVWIGGGDNEGIPLTAGSVIEPPVSGDIGVYAGTGGDRLFLVEVV